MEIVAAVVVAVVVLVVAFLAWQRRRMSGIAQLAEPYNRYMDLRGLIAARDPAAASPGFDARAEAVVSTLGPKFDPRVPAWDRLEHLEPKLRTFVTSAINPGREEKLDLEVFAETILRVDLPAFRGITPEEWLEAARSFVGDAATWRTLAPPIGKRLDTDAAMEEATAVARRFYAFGSRSWDRERAIAVP